MDQRGLVERAGRGDHDAFGVLVDASLARLDAAARLILRDSELARDAVQEAFVRAWRTCPGCATRTGSMPGSTDSPSVPASTCRGAGAGGSSRWSSTPLDDVPVADDSALVADRDLLDRALARLDPEQRAIVVLRYYLDLTAAGGGGCPRHPARDGVKSRLYRSLTAMRITVVADGVDSPRRTHGTSGMTADERLGTRLTDTLAGTSTPALRNDILAQTSRTRQRPAWTFPERWLPMTVRTPAFTAVPPMRTALFLLLIGAADGRARGERRHRRLAGPPDWPARWEGCPVWAGGAADRLPTRHRPRKRDHRHDRRDRGPRLVR